MFDRSIKLPERQSFFLFGARGTGKSTLIKNKFEAKNTFYIDLLLGENEDLYTRSPDSLYGQILALPPDIKTVIIDEVQKIPKLLDIVHKLIVETKIQFGLTGSSARKLRHGSANMLAGRAFERTLHPLTSTEMKDTFSLEDTLAWGSLPEIIQLNKEEKSEFLKTYSKTYLKEEIWNEHLIRKLDPFRKFLEVAAQHNGKIINYTSIAKDVGVDVKTVQEYFRILEDTLVGFILEPYLKSERKRVLKSPKFYFFDIGVCRALANVLSVAVSPSTSYYGEVFEHFFILEMLRKEAYFPKDYRFYYMATEKNEVDLLIERPGKTLAAIEIKSTKEIRKDHVVSLQHMKNAFVEVELFCVSQDPRAQIIDNVLALPWWEALEKI